MTLLSFLECVVMSSGSRRGGGKVGNLLTEMLLQ